MTGPADVPVERVLAENEQLRGRVARLREEITRMEARLSSSPPRTKVVCPGCGHNLGDVIDSLIRQRGKFKAHREMARAENARLRQMLDVIVDGETTDSDWECVPMSALDSYRSWRDSAQPN